MRYSAEHKEQTRARILEAAAREFRIQGFDGLGLDAMTKAAGVTNGAFYGHFATKADAFREVVARGLAGLKEGVIACRARDGAGWLAHFARYYFSEPKIAQPENACVLPSFAPEMTRAPDEIRASFREGLVGVRDAISAGLSAADEKERAQKAWVALALLVGGATLARSAAGTPIAAEIADALTRELDLFATSADDGQARSGK